MDFTETIYMVVNPYYDHEQCVKFTVVCFLPN